MPIVVPFNNLAAPTGGSAPDPQYTLMAAAQMHFEGRLVQASDKGADPGGWGMDNIKPDSNSMEELLDSRQRRDDADNSAIDSMKRGHEALIEGWKKQQDIYRKYDGPDHPMIKELEGNINKSQREIEDLIRMRPGKRQDI